MGRGIEVHDGQVVLPSTVLGAIIFAGAVTITGAVIINNMTDIVAVVTTGEHALSVVGTMTAGQSYGIAANLIGHVAGVGTGVNIGVNVGLVVDGGTPMIPRGLEVSVEGGATVDWSSSRISVLSLMSSIDPTSGAPLSQAMMRFNTDQALDTPDYWFLSANPEAVAYTEIAGETAAKQGVIAVYVIGSGLGLMYLRLYAGQN